MECEPPVSGGMWEKTRASETYRDLAGPAGFGVEPSELEEMYGEMSSRLSTSTSPVALLHPTETTPGRRDPDPTDQPSQCRHLQGVGGGEARLS